MNKDEALKCLELSKVQFTKGNTVEAVKFAKKSIALHKTAQAGQWLEFLESQKVTEARKSKVEPSPPSDSRSYTKEQVEGVKRILSKKDDLYAILQLEKDCSDSDIKKQYRKVFFD
jgi:hypothetical protein